MPSLSSLLRVLLLSTLSVVVSLSISLTHTFDQFEKKGFDLLSRQLNPGRSPGDIVIVQIDQQSIDALSKEGVTWPWPRQIYGPIIEHVSAADAVLIDILFTEPSSYGQQDDELFARAIKQARVFLPVFLSVNTRPMQESDLQFMERVALPCPADPGVRFNSAITPIDPLKEAVKGAGNVTIAPDDDGVYRSTPLLFRFGDATIPHFVLSYLLSSGHLSLSQGRLLQGADDIPRSEGRLLLRFYRDDNPFPRVSAVDILQASLQGIAMGPLLQRDYYKGKTVFIGLTAAGLYDLKPTSTAHISTGVLIHATVLDNLLHRNYLKPLGRLPAVLLMLVLSLLITHVVLRYHSLMAMAASFSVGFGLSVFVPAFFFSYGRYMSVAAPPLALCVSFSVAAAYSYATEGRQRRFIRGTFSRYMDKALVDYLLKNPRLVGIGGWREYVTVFFCDLAGFTGIAEKRSPEEVAKVLNTFFGTFTNVIIQNKGVIDKYIGDSIMAFWGAPLKTVGDQTNACRAALRCTASLDEMNARLTADGLPTLAARIGLHSGEALVGNFGSDKLFNFTVVGDVVNLASRLESANRFFKTHIIVSEDTLKNADPFLTRELGLIRVKGRLTPVRIYELLGEPSDSRISALTSELLAAYQRAQALFYEQRFQEALEAFSAILAKDFDGPSDYYRKKCAFLLASHQRPEDWDILNMKDK